MTSNVRIREVETFQVRVRCRTPLKFGAVVVDELPIGFARVTVENGAGARADGWGAMFLMHLWSWPDPSIPPEARSRVICDVFQRYADLLSQWDTPGHPIEIFCENEAELEGINREVSERHTPGDVMPHLGALVAASPIDHAVHDAFGKVNGIDSYDGYSPEFMDFDLSRYLGREYRDVYPSQFLRQDYAPTVPVFHLVGGLDPLHPEEVPGGAPRDGVPNSLDDWIKRDGVYCLKVKLRGRDIEWDVERTIDVSRVYHDVREDYPTALPPRPHLTADTNEMCETPEYIVEYLRHIRDAAPDVFDEILYIEQPTERDLGRNQWDMRGVAALKPVIIDESLSRAEDFTLAMELGWSGIALKSCKCLSSDLLFIAMAEMRGVPYAVQDLTNPSIALVESMGLAARSHTIMGVEANSRQFFPASNEHLLPVHSGLCEARHGVAKAGSISGPGLGFRVDELPGFAEFVAGGAQALTPGPSP